MLADADLLFPNWPTPPRVRALFTTRHGGVSIGPYASLNLGLHVGDDAVAVAENRRRVSQRLPAQPCWLNQVHGTNVARINAATDYRNLAPADAAVTDASGIPCAVMVADCLPVLFCDHAASFVGAAHAGWRGLAEGVLERTVAALPVAPRQVMAWLGPAIGPAAFEVGEEVVEHFLRHDPAAAGAFVPHRPGKHLADIFELARQRLHAAGIVDIFGGGECTVSNPERYFSYRRDRHCGRMAAMIWLEDQ